MASEREITIVIKADGTAAIAGIQSVEKSVTGLGSSVKGMADAFQKNWAAITVGAAAAFAALNKAWDWMEKAAQTQEAFETLETFTAAYGISAEQMARSVSDASQGLIGMASAAKLANDALSRGLTPEQLTNIAKYAPAIDDASSSVNSAKEAFDAMADAVATGNERSLRKLLGTSIDLKQVTEDYGGEMNKAEKSAALYAQAMDFLKKQYGENVEAQNSAADRMERFNNQLEGAKFFVGQLALVVGGPLMAAFQAVGATIYMMMGTLTTLIQGVAYVTDELGISTGATERFGKKADEWFSRSGSLAKAAGENFASALEQLQLLGSYSPGLSGKAAPKVKLPGDAGRDKAAEAAARELAKFQEAQIKIVRDEYLALSKDFATSSIDSLAALAEIDAIASEARKKQEEFNEKQRTATRDAIVGLMEDFADSGYDTLEVIAAIDRATEEVYQKRLAYEQQIRDINKEQTDLLFRSNMANAQESLGKIGGAEFAQNLGMFASINAGKDPYQQDYDQWAALQDKKIMAMEAYGAAEAEIRDAYRQYEIQQEQTQTQQKIQMAASSFGMMASFAQAAYNASDQKSKAAFNLMKAMRIGEAMMNTYSSAIAAYNAMAGIPIVGPALAAAAAAAAVAFGLMQVRAIASAKPGGSAAASVGGGGMPGIGTGASIPAATAPKEETKQPPQINVHIYGNVVDHDAFAREIVPSLTKALSDGVR